MRDIFLLDSLDVLKIKAIFSSPETKRSYRKLLIQEIIRRGHSIENGVFAGKITDEMEYNDIAKKS